MFKDLIAMRSAHPPLRRGGLRWLIALDDALRYLRETDDERIRVVASRAPWSGALLPAALCGDSWPQTLYGDVDLQIAGGAMVVAGAGPGIGM